MSNTISPKMFQTLFKWSPNKKWNCTQFWYTVKCQFHEPPGETEISLRNQGGQETEDKIDVWMSGANPRKTSFELSEG